MTAHATVLVVCPDCDGTTLGTHTLVCGWCNGMGHIAVNRAPDGGVPEGYTEWCPPMLPETPPEPVRRCCQ